MRLFFVLIIVLSFIGCKRKGRIYTAHDGTKCKTVVTFNCGVDLYDCENGSEYECETNVRSEPIK